MNKYIWIAILSVLMLTGCGESKEEEQERKAREFWSMRSDDSDARSNREKLYDKCYDKNVRDYTEMKDEAKRISGNSNIGSAEFLEVFRPMERERDKELAKCKKIRSGN